MTSRRKPTIFDIKKKTLKVKVGGEEPVLDGEMFAGVKMEDCFWSVEDDASTGGRLVSITLTKSNQMEWWKNVVAGEPEINTQKVRVAPRRVLRVRPDGSARAMADPYRTLAHCARWSRRIRSCRTSMATLGRRWRR